MHRIEPLWELVQEERLVRWAAVAGVGLLWLAVAWLSPLPLLVAVLLAGSVYVVRRRRTPAWAKRDDELDML